MQKSASVIVHRVETMSMLFPRALDIGSAPCPASCDPWKGARPSTKPGLQTPAQTNHAEDNLHKRNTQLFIEL